MPVINIFFLPEALTDSSSEIILITFSWTIIRAMLGEVEDDIPSELPHDGSSPSQDPITFPE
jgi:hypothetical protein